ncbi:hypothetical protein GQX73_g10689 [Xylaria multiplex]|uniref:Thioredoxin domain-containing protein n=1 Tax=Xylaria multiplex TaxID=323545 RepID=A0A7C8IKW1_9PEZI|nr:hypothetical protein GQX73_g10689 [Xylaria multiplex]
MALSRKSNSQVPKTIPYPADDGLASHLVGSSIPTELTLVSTQQIPVKLSELPGITILFCYPRTSAPGETVKERWNNTPGGRGCTAEVGSYRDNFASLKELGVSTIYGLSVQDTAYQKEVKERMGLPYDILSDDKLEFVKAMKMPVLEWEGTSLTKRCTLAIKDGKVVHVWYPVFPPDENPSQVAAWLKATEQSG